MSKTPLNNVCSVHIYRTDCKHILVFLDIVSKVSNKDEQKHRTSNCITQADNATFTQNLVIGKGVEFVNVINQCFSIELSENSSRIV